MREKKMQTDMKQTNGGYDVVLCCSQSDATKCLIISILASPLKKISMLVTNRL